MNSNTSDQDLLRAILQQQQGGQIDSSAEARLRQQQALQQQALQQQALQQQALQQQQRSGITPINFLRFL